ncbi:hypothetical protein J3R30DRAFT_3426106 [Lentinula aciculospora]|uniref:Uncharacterized protein n=1 Tax=Lentinula aciculospora TaxID=153920 RepID=A0A9W9AJ08_9AGAR|nr:hypothetical protein J3R30DRAFT_3453259 [Lentinula aciculospora]KAJ4490866.1 hypothetical protein J3R30DRAFT_3426106 [Lentinula aciculospora]
MDEVWVHAISAIEDLPDVDPVDKVVLARTHDIHAWFTPSFNNILQRSQSFTESDVEKLGVPTIVRLMEIRDCLRIAFANQGMGLGLWVTSDQRFLLILSRPFEDYFLSARRTMKGTIVDNSSYYHSQVPPGIKSPQPLPLFDSGFANSSMPPRTSSLSDS